MLMLALMVGKIYNPSLGVDHHHQTVRLLKLLQPSPSPMHHVTHPSTKYLQPQAPKQKGIQHTTRQQRNLMAKLNPSFRSPLRGPHASSFFHDNLSLGFGHL